jgi:hypothetical protein
MMGRRKVNKRGKFEVEAIIYSYLTLIGGRSKLIGFLSCLLSFYPSPLFVFIPGDFILLVFFHSILTWAKRGKFEVEAIIYSYLTLIGGRSKLIGR